jgi:hypothetical protein
VKPAAALVLPLLAACASPASRGPSVLLVTLDGVRWQEIFSGADAALFGKGDAAVKERFWRDTPEQRREALMPFLWGVMAREGAVLGDAANGSEVRVTNAYKVSYPGYHELLSGFPHPEIKDNSPIWNPNPTVLEWLDGREAFRGSVAAWTSWDRFEHILNRERVAFPLWFSGSERRPKRWGGLLEDLPPPWKGSVYDAFVMDLAVEDLRFRKPRVAYLALGDTDEWAHAGRYDKYLESLRRADAWLEMLWRMFQSMPEYRGRISMLVTADHGRGEGPEGWKHHNARQATAGHIWVAAIGARVRASGLAEKHEPLALAQVAATVAALVGEDFRSGAPQASPPLPFVTSGSAGR